MSIWGLWVIAVGSLRVIVERMLITVGWVLVAVWCVLIAIGLVLIWLLVYIDRIGQLVKFVSANCSYLSIYWAILYLRSTVQLRQQFYTIHLHPQFNNSFWLDNSIVSKYCIGTVWLRWCNNKLTFQGRYRSQIFPLSFTSQHCCSRLYSSCTVDIFRHRTLCAVPRLRYPYPHTPIFRNPQIRYGWRWPLRVPHISQSVTRYGLTVRVRRTLLSLSAYTVFFVITTQY